MTIPEALIVATSTNRQLYALEYQNCERAREAALDVLATELERVSKVAGEYIETDPEYIGPGCVDVLVIHAEQLRERAKRAEEDGRLLSAQYGAACMQYESTLAGLKADLERQSTMDMQMTVLMGEVAVHKAEVERLRTEVSVNAKMLARQCDLARDAELAASHAEKERNAACTERDESLTLTNEYRVDLVKSNLIANNLRDERDALKAEIARLAPLLAIYGWGGCTMDEIVPVEPGACQDDRKRGDT